MIRKRTIIRFILAAAAAAALLFFPAADNALAAVPHTYAACNGHPGVEYGTTAAYECVYARKGEGTLIWAVNVYVISYYWHPSTGNMVVAETFYRTCAQIAAEGAKCPYGLRWWPVTVGFPLLDTLAKHNTRLARASAAMHRTRSTAMRRQPASSAASHLMDTCPVVRCPRQPPQRAGYRGGLALAHPRRPRRKRILHPEAARHVLGTPAIGRLNQLAPTHFAGR
jgi:hypothetical protein